MTTHKEQPWWAGETQIQVSDISNHVPLHTTGKPISVATAYLWTTAGAGGVCLRRFKVGRTAQQLDGDPAMCIIPPASGQPIAQAKGGQPAEERQGGLVRPRGLTDARGLSVRRTKAPVAHVATQGAFVRIRCNRHAITFITVLTDTN